MKIWKVLIGILLMVALAAASSALAACGSDSDPGRESSTSGSENARPATGDDLHGTFTEASVEGKKLPDGARIRLTFEGKTIGANLGCNSMSGTYTIEDGTLEASPLISTMMACSDDLMDADKWLSRFLAKPLHASMIGEELVLADSTVTVTLKPVETAEASTAGVTGKQLGQ